MSAGTAETIERAREKTMAVLMADHSCIRHGDEPAWQFEAEEQADGRDAFKVAVAVASIIRTRRDRCQRPLSGPPGMTARSDGAPPRGQSCLPEREPPRCGGPRTPFPEDGHQHHLAMPLVRRSWG
jgi:hypothetical protein